MLTLLLLAVTVSGAVVSLLPSWDLFYLIALGAHPLLGGLTAAGVLVYMQRRLRGRLSALWTGLPLLVAVGGGLLSPRMDLLLAAVGLAHLGGARLLLAGRVHAGGWVLYLLWNLALASGLAQLACLWRGGAADIARLHLSLGIASVVALALLLLAARHWPRRLLRSGAGVTIPLLVGARMVQTPVQTWTTHLSARDLAEPRLTPSLSLSSEVLQIEQTCETCHTDAVQSHALSAHALSLRTPHMQAVVDLAMSEEGASAWQACVACHAPRALTQPDTDTARVASLGGLRCMDCHLVQSVALHEEDATLTYALSAHAALFLDANGAEYPPRGAALAAIRLSPLRHAAAFSAPVLAEDRFCVACHRDQIPPSQAGGLQPLRCVECHLPDGDHAMPGANAALPFFAGFPEATARLASWIGGEDLITLRGWEYLWTVREKVEDAPPAAVWLTLFHEDLSEARRGAVYQFRVQSSNVGAPHAFPSGDLSLSEAWLDVRVEDATGRVLLQTRPGEVRLGGALLDADGQPIMRYRVWAATDARIDAVIPGGRHRNDDLAVEIPADAVGPLRVRGTWRYRKLSPELARWVYGAEAEVPVISLGHLVHEVALP